LRQIADVQQERVKEGKILPTAGFKPQFTFLATDLWSAVHHVQYPK